mgnify:FL=1
MGQVKITIARQYGSGGREIGRRLAQKLSIPFYGKTELMELAKTQPDYQEVRSFYEEQPVNSLLYAIAMNQEESRGNRIPFQRIREICGEESFVLIGRCGNYIFRDQPDCVKLFIYAGPEKKKAWVMRQEGISEKKAERLIKRIEGERAQTHQFYTGEPWGAVNHYDLCIDAGILGTEGTVELIMTYLKNRGLV